jgi:GNAT superfamily N-acetyltransferase
MEVREAEPDDLAAVMGVLDAAMLATGAPTVRERIGDGVLVADDGGRVIGALVLDGSHVDAVAVRRSRRGQGIGSVLVEAAADRRGRLTADFRPEVRPFYESLGFDVAATDREDRLRGCRPPDS